MAEIDKHADPIHLAHNLFAEWREAAMARRIGRAVDPRSGFGMAERHVEHALRSKRTQDGEIAINWLAALHADH